MPEREDRGWAWGGPVLGRFGRSSARPHARPRREIAVTKCDMPRAACSPLAAGKTAGTSGQV